MPIVSPSFGQSIAQALDEVLESLRTALRDATSALDPQQMLSRLQPLFGDLAALLEDFTPVPADGAFLVADGITPRAGQVGYDEFARLVVDAVAGVWSPELTDAYGPIETTTSTGGALGTPPGVVAPGAGAGVGTAGGPAGPAGSPAVTLASFLRAIAPILDPELFIRYALNLKYVTTDPATVANEVATALPEAMAAALASVDPVWGEDEPMDDEAKKLEQPQVGIGAGTPLAQWIEDQVRKFPGATGPIGPRVGRDVHRAIMAKYVLDHPGRVVLVDGILQMQSTTPLKVRLSRLLTPAGQSISPDPQFIAFANLMRTPPPANKRVHPDISDMAPAPTLADDWGWFEIKPMADIRLAYNELFFYYLPMWNSEVVMAQPDWVKTAGVWQPTMISVTPRYKYAFAAVTMPPGGAIGYLTYELAAAAKAAEAVILTVIAGMFMKRMLKDLRQIGEDLLPAAAAVAEFVFGWASLLIMVVLAVLAAIALIPEEALAGIASAIGALIARLAPLVEQLIEAAPAIQ